MDLQIMPVLNASILSQYQYGMERLWYSPGGRFPIQPPKIADYC